MPSRTWGTGTDVFAVDYLEAQVPDSGSGQWQSSDINNHMLSALELRRMSGHFEAGIDTRTGSSTPEDTPLSLKQEGASQGYYRTIHYSSHYADSYFFSQNILMWDRHIITNVSDIQRLVWTPTITEDTFENASMVDGTTKNITCYSISQFENSKVDILKKGKNDEYTATSVSIVPAIISPDSPNHLQGFNYWGRVDEHATWVDGQLGRYNQTYGTGSNNTARYCPVFGNGSPVILPNSANETSKWAIDDTGNYAARFVYKAADQYSYLWTTYINVKYWVCSEDELLHVLARSGMKFVYKDTMYKPVAENGVIVGYTANMDDKSDWDEWHDYTDHEVPVTPPTPGPGDDDSDWDDIGINGAGIGGGSAFCRFYYCTEAELANLRTWTMGLSQSGDPIPAGFDPKSNIIGLTVFPFTLSGNGPTTIKFTTNGGQDPVTQQEMPRVVDSGVSCEGGAGATVSILNATIDVPATMKSRGEPWLDYESYIELFIPLCGIYQVDPQVVIGRTIHVQVFLDPVSGTVMGIAWVPKENGKCIIAQGSGTPGVQIPVAVGNYGLAQAARVQNTLSGFTGTATSAISTQMVSNAFQNRAGERGLNSVRKISNPNSTAGSKIAAFNRSGGSAILGFSGLLSSAQHWVSARQIANSPGTSASGGFSGSMAEWCGVFTPYVKIVRPKFRKPGNYKHTCGEPEVTTRTLNSVGYAVCINPDISGLTNATEAEKAAVYQYLSTGVYYK